MVTTRRTLLRVAAGTLPITLAGCTGGGGGQEGDGETATETETATATATATETETATETGTGATAGGSGPTVGTRSHPDLGPILVDSAGRTLYMFDNDTQGAGASACTGGCLETWPPLAVEGEPTAAGDVGAELATFERSDGSTQVTASGLPLYYYASDEDPGDAAGQGVGGVWWVLSPDGSPVRSDGTPTTTTTSGGGMY